MAEGNRERVEGEVEVEDVVEVEVERAREFPVNRVTDSGQRQRQPASCMEC